MQVISHNTPNQNPDAPEFLALCCVCGETFSSVACLKTHFEDMHNKADSLTSNSSVESDTDSAMDTSSAFPSKVSIKHRQYSCEYCNRLFTKSCNLRSHIRSVHNGVKSHECVTCRKLFTRNSDLQKHIDAVHKGLRPFKCHICSRSFSQKSSMKRHIEAVHEGASTSINSRGSLNISSNSTLSSNMPELDRNTPVGDSSSSISPCSANVTSLNIVEPAVSAIPNAFVSPLNLLSDEQISKLTGIIESLTNQGLLDSQNAEKLFIFSLIRLLQQTQFSSNLPAETNQPNNTASQQPDEILAPSISDSNNLLMNDFHSNQAPDNIDPLTLLTRLLLLSQTQQLQQNFDWR